MTRLLRTETCVLQRVHRISDTSLLLLFLLLLYYLPVVIIRCKSVSVEGSYVRVVCALVESDVSRSED